MSVVQKTKPITLINAIIVSLAFVSIDASSSELSLAKPPNPIIGYGYATSVLPAKSQESFLSGFELGFQNILGDQAFRKYVLVQRDTSGSPSGSLAVLGRLLEKEVTMIVGFPTSHEALQVGESIHSKGILTIFPAAGHSRLAKLGPTIFTTGESMKGYVRQTSLFLRKKFGNAPGLLVYNPSAIFSVNQKDEFQSYFKIIGEQQSPRITTAALDRDLRLPMEVIRDLKNGKYLYTFITMYSDESFSLVGQQFPENRIDLPIVTNSSWTTGDIEFVRRAVSQKKAAIITGAVWIPGSPESKPFETMVKETYGMVPTTDLASGFDVGVIAATLVQRSKGDYTKTGLLKAFNQNRCFNRVSIGKICFPTEGGHGDGTIKFKHLTKKGLADL